MSKFMTYDYWVDTFQPITNSIRNNGELDYETYGEEFEYVSLQDPKNVWTEVDGDSGTYITAGFHYINRVQYYITIKPWEDEYTEVPTWVYRQCDCTEVIREGILEFYGDYDPDCTECDEGMIDIPVDTIEDLKQLYGDEADIVG